MEETAMTVQSDEPRVLSATEMQQQVQAIQQVMSAVMKDGTHYGVVPGCGDKPTLLKPGAEKIMMTFRLGVDPEVEDLSTGDCLRYRVKARIFSILTGQTLGYGVGEASTDETKYKWRSAVSAKEFEAADPSRRRVKFGKNYDVNQVRTEIADVANTVLKMAKKRGLVDGVLTVTAASDFFTQDIEDIPEENLDKRPASGKPPVQQPQAKTYATSVSTPAASAPVPADKLKPETVSQITDMMTEMGWVDTVKHARMQWANGVGDEKALDVILADYQKFLNGKK